MFVQKPIRDVVGQLVQHLQKQAQNYHEDASLEVKVASISPTSQEKWGLLEREGQAYRGPEYKLLNAYTATVRIQLPHITRLAQYDCVSYTCGKEQGYAVIPRQELEEILEEIAQVAEE